MNFRTFLENTEEEDNIKSMLKKIPKKHAALMKGFRFRYVPGNVLPGDKEHIGLIKGKTITVAGPWNYGREFTTLHEVGHMVFEKLVTKKLQKKWADLVSRTKNTHVTKLKKDNIKATALDQNDEELFCMSYAAAYANHPSVVWHHPEWISFIKNDIPK